MVTRFCVGSNRPVKLLNLHVYSVSPLPRSYRKAFNDVNWKNAIRYKARLVANGSTQLEGVDVDETLSPVVKPETIHTVLSLDPSRHWPVHQLDEFAMTDLGSFNYFLGISVARDSSGMFLSQKNYAVKILERADMVNCNPSRTSVDTESKLGTTGDVVSDPTMYRSLAGSLQYLTFTRPDISYVVQHVCLHMHDPRELRFMLLNLVAYSDADWASYPTTRRQLQVTMFFLATIYYSGPLSVNRRFLVPVQKRSIVGLQMLLLRLRTKHIEIDIHFVRYLVVVGEVRVLHILSRYQFADIFTKVLTSALFEEFRSSLSVRSPPAPTAMKC
nr:hypothetical protein [Tanacetum cinerariifolium]